MSITRIGSYQIKGSSYKLPCLLATTNNITFATPPTTVDGVTTSTNNRILVWKQTIPSENGIYIVGASSWTRAIDFSLSDDTFNGAQVYVTAGTTNQGTYYLSTSDPIVLDSTGLTFIKSITAGSSTYTGITSTSIIQTISYSASTTTAVFFDYYVINTTSSYYRSGTIMSVCNGTTTTYTDTSTPDLGGPTTGITLSVDYTSPNIRLVATITSGTWTIKLATRVL